MAFGRIRVHGSVLTSLVGSHVRNRTFRRWISAFHIKRESIRNPIFGRTESDVVWKRLRNYTGLINRDFIQNPESAGQLASHRLPPFDESVRNKS